MEKYDWIRGLGGMMIGSVDVTKAGLENIYKDIELGLNTLNSTSDESKRYSVTPLERCEGGILITGGPKQLSETEDKQMRFLTEDGSMGLKFWRFKADQLIFSKTSDAEMYLRGKRWYSWYPERFEFKTNGKKHHWTYREACVVQSCFAKMGFRFKPVPKRGWRKE